MTSFSLDNAKYLPTFISVGDVQSLSPGANPICEIRDRELRGRILRVQKVAVNPNGNVTVRLRENNRSVEESNAISIDNSAQFDLHCRTLFYLDLYNSSIASINNFPYRYGYWLLNPTIADKVFYDLRLSSEEELIASEYDIKRLVDEGSLPLPIDTMLKRVFKKSTTRTVSWHGDISAADGADIGSEVSSVGKMLAIESVALDKPPSEAYTTALNITVDETSFLELKTWACSGSLSDIPLFIPAKDSFHLSLTTNTAITGYDMRYTYSEFRITPYVSSLFSLRPRSEDEDMWRRVQSGIGPE